MRTVAPFVSRQETGHGIQANRSQAAQGIRTRRGLRGSHLRPNRPPDGSDHAVRVPGAGRLGDRRVPRRLLESAVAAGLVDGSARKFRRPPGKFPRPVRLACGRERRRLQGPPVPPAEPTTGTAPMTYALHLPLAGEPVETSAPNHGTEAAVAGALGLALIMPIPLPPPLPRQPAQNII